MLRTGSLEALQRSGGRPASHLHGRHRRRGQADARGVRGPLGCAGLPIEQSWRRNWSRLIPFFDYPPEIRNVIYTTNAIESVNMGLRKLSKNRGSFLSDEALTKLFYLALRNISQK